MSLIESYIAEPGDESFTAILTDTENSPKGVLGLVEQLGTYLTSIDKEERGNASKLLASVIDQHSNFPAAEVEHLSDFFCDRIKDHHSIVPHVLTAFSALSRHADLPDACAVLMVRSIFQHAEVQTLIQQHRALAFQVITNLLNNKLDALKMMKEAFTLGYIQVIDGEKDPRNLMTVFQLTQVVINNFPYGVCCEDLFEVTSCYFPVDFTPPPGDGFQITKQQLVDELRAVMSSTARFSLYCVPLLIEKISSDLQSAKQDSFHTLADCCKVYTVDDLRPFMKTVTQLILREAMLSPSQQTEELALHACGAVAKCLASPIDGVTLYNDVDEYCKDLLKDCKHHLFEPGHKLVVPSVKILQSLISSHHHVAHILLSDVLPMILEQLNDATETKKRRVYLDMLKQILSCSKSDITQHKLQALPSVLQYIYHEDESITESAVQCLAVFADCITDNVEEVSTKLINMVDTSQSESLRTVCCACLAVLCKEKLTDGTPYVMSCVTDRLTSQDTLDLHTLQLVDTISQHCAADVCSVILSPLLLRCERCLKERNELVEPVLNSISLLLNTPPPQLDVLYLNQFIDLCLNTTEENVSPALAEHVNNIIIQLVNATDESLLGDIAMKLKKDTRSHSLAVIATQSFLCTVPATVVDIGYILDQYIPIATDSTISDHRRKSGCKICCSFINKIKNVDPILERFSQLLTSKSIFKVELSAWIAKALILRNHKQGRAYLDQIITWLMDSELSHLAAESFEIILKDYSDVMNPRQHPIVRMMYKQRVFVSVFPKLHQMFNTIQPDLLANVHIAVTHLIRYVPSQVLSNDKEMLLGVLLRLLTSSDDQVLLRTLQVISDISDSDLLSPHVDTLLPIMIKLSHYKDNMKVRISALECLSQLSKLNITLLVPHMDVVIKGLIPALDDRKRLVRREAVKTRNAWCLVRDGE